MKKKFLLLAIPILAISISKSQIVGRLLDQPMKLKRVSFNIHSDAFVASTFIEVEFYNPTDKEIEGLFRFQLDPGQVITGFQLELNGKFRDGSIEERWKARSAYNSIVGKRVDPALLQYEYNNNYRLNIYPIPAKSTRKVTFTIQQLLHEGKNELIYWFPLNGRDTVEHFETNIEVTNVDSKPVFKRGLFAGNSFRYEAGKSTFGCARERLFLSGEISFAIPLTPNRNIYCTRRIDEKTYYALRLTPHEPNNFVNYPRSIAVYWDASASAVKRNLKKEINFLRQYISYFGISYLTVTPFTHTILATMTFYTKNNSDRPLEQYLRSLNYDGATQFGCLDFSKVTSDVILLFSDGKNSYGRSIPNIGTSLVYCVTSSQDADIGHLQEIVGSNGGTCIDLNKMTMTDAISQSGKLKNWLVRVSSSSGKMTSDQLLPISADDEIMLTGTIAALTDTLTLYYGHGNSVAWTEALYANYNDYCTASTNAQIRMLQQFSLTANMPWEDVLEFGLKEKVVTANTSYIVLEKIEDYIKYNIAPPEDLQEESKKLNYVRKDSRSYRLKFKEQDEFEIVNNVVESYNKQIKHWEKNADTIRFNRQDYDASHIVAPQSQTLSETTGPLIGKTAGVSIGSERVYPLSEVVVTGYGNSLRRDLTASVSYYRGNQIFPGLTIEQNLAGRVAGLEVYSNGSPGNQSGISIRGIASLSNRQPLFIIDGLPVTGNPNDYIAVNDIESITVLKDGASMAIYGSRGANGVIIINSKKSRNYWHYNYSHRSYRLKDMDDVDYMQQLKSTSMGGKVSVYNELRVEHGADAGFYFDVAQHFFEIGLKEDAMQILLNASEISDGNVDVLKALGYTLEAWKNYAEAIKVYKQILQIDPDDLYTRHDLAWAYFQNGNYQEAVGILYESIKLSLYRTDWYKAFKAVLLNDMNAIIAMKKDELDISTIPAALVKPLPVDLRIMVEGNKNDVYNMTIIEPGGANCSLAQPVSRHGGYISAEGSGYYHSNPVEYEIRKAMKGTYKIRVNYYDYYQAQVPSFVRIVTFRNYGKPNQKIEMENVIMDNQYGDIEIGEVELNK